MKKIYILELKNPTYFMSISLTAEKEKEYERVFSQAFE